MKYVILKKSFINHTSILFERIDARTVIVRWQIFTDKLEIIYSIGQMDFTEDMNDARLSVFADNLMRSSEFHEEIAHIVEKMMKSKNKEEREYFKRFYEKYKNDTSNLLV